MGAYRTSNRNVCWGMQKTCAGDAVCQESMKLHSFWTLIWKVNESHLSLFKSQFQFLRPLLATFPCHTDIFTNEIPLLLFKIIHRIFQCSILSSTSPSERQVNLLRSKLFGEKCAFCRPDILDGPDVATGKVFRNRPFCHLA